MKRKPAIVLLSILSFFTGLALLPASTPLVAGNGDESASTKQTEKSDQPGDAVEPASSSSANGVGQKVYHIYPHRLDQMEDLTYETFLKESFRQAREEGINMIILEIDTPGGELAATLEIKNVVLGSSIKTVCFVNRNAISAGSLIALSCDKLVMAPGSVIGAATPVYIRDGGMQKAPEKVVSATRAAWRSTAQARDRDPDVAEAFVDESIVLTKKKNKIDKPAGKLLTLTDKEAFDIGLIDYRANTIVEILEIEKMSQAAVIVKEPTFKDRVIAFILHPAVSGILIALGMVGLLFEIKSPGWGIPGVAGLLFLSIYFIARIYAGYSGWAAPALFAFSILLILLEIFVIPGFGFAGIIGVGGLIGSILWSYGVSNFNEGLWVVSLALVGFLGATGFLLKNLKYLRPKSDSILLSGQLTPEKSERYEHLSTLIGKKGKTLTVLRPSGTITINGERVDAVSLGEFIDAGKSVSVVQVEGSKVLVEKS